MREDKEIKRDEQLEAQEKIDEQIEEIMSQCKGTIELETPWRARSQDVNTIYYDFFKLNGTDYLEIMDGNMRSMRNSATNNMTEKQYFELFAKAVEKVTPDIDATDVKEQADFETMLTGVDLAKNFLLCTRYKGKKRISKE